MAEDRAQFAIDLITPAGLLPHRSMQTLMQIGTGKIVSRFSKMFDELNVIDEVDRLTQVRPLDRSR